MPRTIVLNHVSFRYESLPRPVFSGLTLSFPPGWTALVGPNGCGKSTLLSLVTGRLTPESGSLVPARDASVCGQGLDMPEAFFSDPELMGDPDTRALLSRLGIREDFPGRWGTLSGGEKRKCTVAAALAGKPEVLLLDEPANHVDADTLDLLAAELARFNGIGILVSHNRSFLDRVCRRTVLLTPGEAGSGARTFACPPGAALQESLREDDFLRGERAALEARLRRLERRRILATREAAAGAARLSKRDLDPRDASGRAEIDRARLTGKDGRAGRSAGKLAGQAGRVRAELESRPAPGLRKSGAALPGRRERRPVLLDRAPGILDLAGGTVRLEHPRLEIRNDGRTAILGPNGSGKTSLLRWIRGSLDLPEDRVWYLEQELSERSRREALSALRTLGAEDRGRVLSAVYRLGSEPESLLSTDLPSPGETRKLLFALALLRGVSAVLLDEPTNHMDPGSAACFSEALADFEGAVVLVTHDEAFTGRVAEGRWRLERDGIRTVLSVTGGEDPTQQGVEKGYRAFFNTS
ncbi:MAG TPA: ATP-binding cassette domain-containing protein [Spirochaetales bacterium]|nr:ATP-binding cassette domain-containing protein [Spirochaetales bacterium]